MSEYKQKYTQYIIWHYKIDVTLVYEMDLEPKSTLKASSRGEGLPKPYKRLPSPSTIDVGLLHTHTSYQWLDIWIMGNLIWGHNIEKRELG